VSYLIDTNVISAVAPTRRNRPCVLVDWLDRASAELYLSIVTSVEIRDGIAKADRDGAARKANVLRELWVAVEHLYAERILTFDLTAATIAGAMMDRARGAGEAPGFADVAIAATAEARGLTILTRNVRHFQPIYARILNPIEGPLPPVASSPPR
jgi:predicted nucleic acid-binding protein